MEEQEKTSGVTEEWLPAQMREGKPSPGSVEPDEWPVPPGEHQATERSDGAPEDDAAADVRENFTEGEAEVSPDVENPGPVVAEVTAEEPPLPPSPRTGPPGVQAERGGEPDEDRAEMDSSLATRLHVEQELQAFSRAVEEIDASVQRTLDGLSDRLTALEEGLDQLLTGFESERVASQEILQVLAAELGTRTGEIGRRVDELNRTVEDGSGQIGDRLAELERQTSAGEGRRGERLDALEERHGQLRSSFEQETATGRELLRNLSEELGSRAGETREQLRSLDRRMAPLQERLEELARGIEGEATARHGAVGDVLEQLTARGDRAEERVGSIDERIESVAGALGRLEVATDTPDPALDEIRTALAGSELRSQEQIRELSEASFSRTEEVERRIDERERADARIEASIGRLAEDVERLNEPRQAEEASGDSADIKGPSTAPSRPEPRLSAPSSSGDLEQRYGERESKLTEIFGGLKRRVGGEQRPAGDQALSDEPRFDEPDAGFSPQETHVPGEGDTTQFDANQASFEDLRGLGLTITQAARMISIRDQRGGFESLDDLSLVPGLPDRLRGEMKRRLTVRQD